MKILFGLALLVVQMLAFAGGFTSFALSNDHASLRITTAGGSKVEAPKYTDQVGFSEPQISADGKYIGWLALYSNCCTSYPIALRLVVLDESRELHSFDGIQLAVFSWCFLANSAEVAFTQTTVHGSNFQYFERRAIRSGKLLGRYEYPHEDDERTIARKRAPPWVHCVPELFRSDAKFMQFGTTPPFSNLDQALVTRDIAATESGGRVGYGFSERKLNRIEADIDPKNSASAKSLERCGFSKRGLLRESCFVNGVLTDSAGYGLLQREWA